MKLSPRLQTVANAVGKCSVLADVGTDHGYIPVYMLENGLCQRAYASDIREQPLARAKAFIEENGLSHRGETFLSDGILNIPEDYDALVIAGMGGETIVSILGAKALPENARLVLQPMTEESTLREYLYTHGYIISDETAVSEPGHVYTVISAEKGETGSYSYEDLLASPCLRQKKTSDTELYVNKFIRKNKAILKGLSNAKNQREAEVSAVERELSAFEKILEEIRK